jgi:putative ABC transport system substrate-binding protein
MVAQALQPERMRRVGVLMPFAADDPQAQARNTAFVQGLAQLGWTDGRNVWIDTRWAAGDADRYRRYAAELIALAPDVIVVSGGTGVGALLQATCQRANLSKRLATALRGHDLVTRALCRLPYRSA